MRLTPLAFAAVVGACAWTPAEAQQAPDVAVQRKLDIGLSVSAIHDSNAAHSDQATAALRGLSRADWTYRPAATFDVVQTVGRDAIFLRGYAGYDFHQRNTKLNRQRIDLTTGVVAPVGMCRATVYGNFVSVQSDLEDVTAVLVKNQQQIVAAAGSVVCARPFGPLVQLSGRHEVLKNSALIQRTANHNSDNAQLVLGYRNRGLGKLGVVIGYGENDLPNAVTPRPIPGNSFLTRMLGINYEKTFGAKLTASVTASRTQVKRDVAPVGVPLKFTANTYAGEIIYTASSRLSLDVTVERAVKPSTQLGKLYDLDRTADASVRYKLGPRLQTTAGVRVENIKSNTDSSLAVPVLTKSQVNAVYASLRYALRDRSAIALDFRHEVRKANLPAFNYTDDRVAITANVTF